jgi:thioredoxin 1
MSKIIEANEDTFEREVEKSALPVLVDFWAPWCGPCRMVAPSMDQIADEYAGKAKVVKINTDNNGKLASRFGIRGIPTVMLFEKGEVRKVAMGVRPKEEYMRYLNRILTTPESVNDTLSPLL